MSSFYTRKKNTNLTWVPLRLANCALVRSHSNAISDICLYANDLALKLKTSGIKHLVFQHRIRDWFHAISQDGGFIYFSFKNLDRFFSFQLWNVLKLLWCWQRAHRNLTLFLQRWHNCAFATTGFSCHLLYKEGKYQINVGAVRVGQLHLVLSHSNAISVICLHVVNLALKTSGIKHLSFKTVFQHRIR